MHAFKLVTNSILLVCNKIYSICGPAHYNGKASVLRKHVSYVIMLCTYGEVVVTYNI